MFPTAKTMLKQRVDRFIDHAQSIQTRIKEVTTLSIKECLFIV